MTLWTAILLACAATYLTKLAGYAVPARWLQNPRMARVAVAFVDDLQPRGPEGGGQSRLDFVFHGHVSATPFNLPRKHLNSWPRVGKAPA